MARSKSSFYLEGTPHPENPKILQILIQTSLFLIVTPFRKVCLDLLRPFPIYFPGRVHTFA